MRSLLKVSTSGLTMLIGSLSGFIASFLLTIDKIKLLKDSQFVPSCNISETLNWNRCICHIYCSLNCSLGGDEISSLVLAGRSCWDSACCFLLSLACLSNNICYRSTVSVLHGCLVRNAFDLVQHHSRDIAPSY